MKNSKTPSVPRTPREINFLQMATFFGGWIRVFICAPYDGENTRSREKIWGYCWFAREHSAPPSPRICIILSSSMSLMNGTAAR